MTSRSARELADHLMALVGAEPLPVIAAVDGRSGAGKSTLAAATARLLGQEQSGDHTTSARPIATVIEGDDFYAGGDAAHWDAMSDEQKVATAMDWRRQRALLTDLRAGLPGRWYPFDWEAFDQPIDTLGRLAAEPLTCPPASIVIIEGAYTARPELADLIDLRVLLDTPREVSESQLREREGEHYSEDWEARWRSAEDHYFGRIMPIERFDLVLR